MADEPTSGRNETEEEREKSVISTEDHPQKPVMTEDAQANESEGTRLSPQPVPNALPTMGEGDEELQIEPPVVPKSGLKRGAVFMAPALDRLKPRSLSDNSKRLCLDERGSGTSSSSHLCSNLMTTTSSSSGCSNFACTSNSSAPSGSSSAAELKKSKKFQKEYGRLKHLVPALTEREDLSKVEIVEETIRYIDALHHQLASRIDPNVLSAAIEDQQNSSSENPNNSNPQDPLRQVSSSEYHAQPRGAASRASSLIPSSMDSPSDLKAAVENIQAMFAAYLQQQPSHPGVTGDNHHSPESDGSSSSSRNTNEEPS